MVAEQERLESKRRQAQGIKLAKAKGIYKGKAKIYRADTKNLEHKRTYLSIVDALNQGLRISEIARLHGVTRQTVYRIRSDINSDLSTN